MPYVERITRAGKTIEVERYFTSRYKKPGIKRGDKVKPTKEQQAKVNTRQAERKLRILMNANFGYGDYHLELDYIRKKGQPDRTKEQMRKDIDVFLRECRKEYKKAGLELKYIHVMEIGERGARHHHLVINKIDTEILQRCWYKAYEGHNRIKVFPLDDSGNYAKLASYFIKYTDKHRKDEDGALQGKRWNCSKNLVRPEPEIRVITDRQWFKAEPREIKLTSLKPAYADLIAAEAALPQAYENGAVWCMSKNTFMQYYGLTDSNGQPIGRVNYGIAGKPERFLLGRQVVCCDYVTTYSAGAAENTAFAFLFNFKDYVLNTNYAMGVKKYEDNDTDDKVTKGIMLVDGKVVDKNSLVTICMGRSA